MKLTTHEHFYNFNYEEAIIKYPDIKTWATGFLLICLAQAATDMSISERALYLLAKEVDRRFKLLQKDVNKKGE